MANRKARVPQADIARALKPVRAAGLNASKLEILADGELRIFLSADDGSNTVNEWDLGLDLK